MIRVCSLCLVIMLLAVVTAEEASVQSLWSVEVIQHANAR